MIESTSQRVPELDDRLLAVEDLFRRRLPGPAVAEFNRLPAADFAADPLNQGLFLSLKAEAILFAEDYEAALTVGAEARLALAPTSEHRRVGRTLWILSKAHSFLGNLVDAEARARDAISAYRRAEHRPGVVNGLTELVRIHILKSDYPRAAEYLQDALTFVDNDPAKERQLRGNLGRIKTLIGEFADADELLSEALNYDLEHDQGIAAARDYLSLGYLRYRTRRFAEAEELFTSAEELIEKHQLKRETLHLAEYRGELAFEKGDYRKARSILSAGLEQSLKLAPDSALVTQIGRRLAETLLELGDSERALTLSQQTLERSERLGERIEIGLCEALVGVVFARSSDVNDSAVEARDYYERGLSELRKVGDPYELAKALLRAGEVYKLSAGVESAPALERLAEAREIFERLNLDYLYALATFRYARRLFNTGRFSEGYAPLCAARDRFEALGDSGHLRQVDALLQSTANEAVAHSLSDSNTFALFGGFARESDATGAADSELMQTLQALRDRTNANRVITLAVNTGATESAELAEGAVAELTEFHSTETGDAESHARFSERFRKMLGQEFSLDSPTALIDSSRDPYIAELLENADHKDTHLISSVIVSPLRAAGKIVGYVYLDRVRMRAGALEEVAPFSQADLDFVVGISNFVGLQITQSQKAQLLEDNRRLKEQIQRKVGFPNIITQNSDMLELLARVRQVIDSDISVTITGETGCGKDLLAKALHYNSARSAKRFISVNCAALPETLLESELFGYKRGAFTGADRDKPGLLEEADGGAFFLDEIGDMPLPIQAKLLRVLEEKEVVRLGESTPRKIDVRIISATHKDLAEAMRRGDFRKDLYYRLCALTFRVPALRERREDIPLLIERFSANSGVTYSPEAMRALVSYDWPGNVRELENEVKKLTLVCGPQKRVEFESLSAKTRGEMEPEAGSRQTNFDAAAAAGIAATASGEDFALYDFIADHERRFISNALIRCHGVKKHAAQLLQIPESTLRLKIKQYDIDLANLGRFH